MPDNDVSEPVAVDRPPEAGPQDGIALCLSGGGYRAMLFHLGAIWRLNEVGYLSKLDRVSSVSGGSITAGTLGMVWPALEFTNNGVVANLEAELVSRVRDLAGRTVDSGAIIGGILTPGSVSSKVASRYDRYLYHGSTLQSLPTDDVGPRFIINATNLQTGVLWRFSRPYMADYKMGRVNFPDVSLATAVAASSAFPPVLSPTVLEIDPGKFDEKSKDWELSHLQARGKAFLSDGGVYDNLGLETAWKRYRTILVSDGGGQLSAEETVKKDWARHSLRVLKVIDSQVRSMRKRQVIDAFQGDRRRGTYWGIRSDPADYGLADPLPTDPDTVRGLADIKTRLKKLGAGDQERLINWGYVICDTALRRWVDPGVIRPHGVPYPSSPIG
jgi:NTE family protein